ncbi:hypothetical protein FHS43_006592 [Streptosporangium becharense]|uniref:Uncharacterized protein n=1 Tax=Streptosporangium becharense TaxID=1816182 RepID=A0A7W9ICW2_9ACTN|nr:hypothetical protein [Streptosporangium becharense]MBB2915272.1 hypothetical protein [Streptosporangium becharense]MBB5817899.1 hypothetical protein [Streptosporangium becharense]
MTTRVLLASLVAGAASLPVPAGAPVVAAEDPVIRSVTIHPAAPVVGPADTVRLVIEVVARGVAGPAGVTVQVEPGAAGPGETVFPVGVSRPAAQAPRPRPGTGPEPRPGPGASLAPRPDPRPGGSPPLTPAPSPLPGVLPGPLPTEVPSLLPGPVSGPSRTPAPATGPGRAVPGHAAARAGLVVRRAADGWETWRFNPEQTLSRWYPAGRWTVTVTAKGTGGRTVVGRRGFQLRRQTRFSAVRAVAGGEGTRVRGVLNRVDPQGYLDYAPFPERPVEILHRTGEEDWAEVGTATTDAHGRFGRTLPIRPGGRWRIRFAGTSHYAPGLSAVHRAE